MAARLTLEARLARTMIADRFAIEGATVESVLSVLVPARDRLYERAVTVEFPRPAIVDDPALFARFVEGARAAVAIEHAGVVRVLGVEYDVDGAPFVVRERVRGALLSERATPMTLDVAWQILDPVIEALATAHALGLVHGALRPAQIALHENARGALRPKIAGFGSAPLFAAIFGDSGPAAPRYAAPELFGGAAPTPASDVWAIAVIACELLSGEHPIALPSGSTAADIARAITGSAPRSLARLVPQAPPAVAHALDRALASSPEVRWPNAGALQAALVDRTRALPMVPQGAAALVRALDEERRGAAPDPRPHGNAPSIDSEPPRRPRDDEGRRRDDEVRSDAAGRGRADPSERRGRDMDEEPRRSRDDERGAGQGRVRGEREERREPTGRSHGDREDQREPTGRSRGDREEQREPTGRSRRDEDDDDDGRVAGGRGRDDDGDDRREPTGRSRREQDADDRGEAHGRARRDEGREPSRRGRTERGEPSGRSRARGRDLDDDLAPPRPRSSVLPMLALGAVLIAVGVGVWLAIGTTPAATGAVVIANLPDAATVLVDGVARAAGEHGRLELGPGAHRIEAAGFVALDVEVASGETVRVELAPVPTEPTPPEPPALVGPAVRSRCFGTWRGGFDCEGGYCDVRTTLTVSIPSASGSCGTLEWARDGAGSGRAELGGCAISDHAATFEEPSTGALRRVSMRCTEARTTLSAYDSEEGESRSGGVRREGEAPPEAELVTPPGDEHPCHGSWSGYSSVTGANVRLDLDALSDARCGRIVDEGTFALNGCELDGSMLEARSELGNFSVECSPDESGATMRSSAWGVVTLSPR